MLELIKPITWFPLMWAYLCGIVSVGVPILPAWPMVLLGVILAGPVVCGMSQAVNDWCDRHVDAVNEPHRPIPSGRISGRWGLWIALAMTVLALALGSLSGRWGFAALLPGLVMGLHHAVQMSRPTWGYRSDTGGKRTRFIVLGMAALAVRGFLAALGFVIMACAFVPGLVVSVLAYTARWRAGGRGG